MNAPAPWRPQPVDLPPGTRVGNWRVIGRLGWGGYGAVYLVRGVRWPRRQAALKLALQPGALSRRLEREGELLARVAHPHVVRFIEAGSWSPPDPTWARLPFLVMEYVPGLQLYAWASQRDARLDEALRLFQQSALALHAVHAAGALHRDVKGENLLVRDGDGGVVLVDLGVGDYAGAAPLTGTQLPPGTAAYRSPEALRFQKEHLGDFRQRYEFRHADDLYALGVTWYRALTGAFPFEAERPEDSYASYRARLEGRLPLAPSALNPRVPPGISDLLLWLLSPRPEERPASAREVAESLAALPRDAGHEREVLLFEWNDGATPHSCITEDAHSPRLPSLERPRWRWGALVLGALLVAMLAIGLASRPRLSLEPSHPTEEGPSMNEPKAPAGSEPAPEAKLSPLEIDFMKSLAAAVCLVTSGCAGVPVSPTWPQDCPPEALAAMARRARSFVPGRQGYLALDINRPGDLSDYAEYRAGPIVSGMLDEHGDSVDLFPLGTRLYGHMWTGGSKVQAYWTRAELPDGESFPVCMVLGFNERGGYWKEPGTQPGSFRISMRAPFTVTRRFERPE